MNSTNEQETHQFEDLIEGLIHNDYGCSDDFMGADTVSGLRQHLEDLSASGEMHAAALG